MFRARSAVHCVCIAGSGPEQNTGRTEHYTKYVHNNAPWAKEHRHAFHPHSLPLLHPSAGESLSVSVCPTHTMCLTFCNPSVGTPPPTLPLHSVPRKSPLQFAFVPAPALPNEPTQHHHPQPLPLPLPLCSSIQSNNIEFRSILDCGRMEKGNGKRTMLWWTSSRCGYRRDWVAMY